MKHLYFWLYGFCKVYLVKETTRDDVQIFSRTLNKQSASLFTDEECRSIEQHLITVMVKLYPEDL